jgi:hypothetical protein
MVAVVVPSVANADAQRQLNTAGDVEEPFERITSAAKRRKIAKCLLETGDITHHEYGHHEAFVTKCTNVANGDTVVANAGVPANDGVPPWFGPALAAALGPALAAALAPALDVALAPALANALAPVLARLDDIDARQRSMEATQHNMEARLVNSVASDPSDQLQGIRNAEGNVARNFPHDCRALSLMTPRAITAFLRHYDLDEPDDDVRKLHEIKKFIGIRIA